MLCILLAGCVADVTDESVPKLNVYRILREEHRNGGDLISPRVLPVPSEPDAVENAFELLRAEDDQLLSPIPEGVRLQSYTLMNGRLALHLSEEYLALGEGYARTISNYCIALTYCGFSNIDAVTIYSGGESVAEELTEREVLLRNDTDEPEKLRLRLYYPDSERRRLDYEHVTVRSGDGDMLPERQALRLLAQEPASEGLIAALPEHIELIAVSTDIAGVCSVNFASGFSDNNPATVREERLFIYSIVNTLCSLERVRSVRFLVDGLPPKSLGVIPLSAPLLPNMEPVGVPLAAKNELLFDIYLAAENQSRLVPIPALTRQELWEGSEIAALTALCGAVSEPGLTSLLTKQDIPLLVETAGGVVSVDLPLLFLASRPDGRSAELAIAAMAATLSALPDIERVVFTIEQKPLGDYIRVEEGIAIGE